MQKEGSLAERFMDRVWGLRPLPPAYLSLQLALLKPALPGPTPGQSSTGWVAPVFAEYKVCAFTDGKCVLAALNTKHAEPYYL